MASDTPSPPVPRSGAPASGAPTSGKFSATAIQQGAPAGVAAGAELNTARGQTADPVGEAPLDRREEGAATPAVEPAPTPPVRVAPPIAIAPGVRVDRTAGRVELDATVCIDAGWLEQVACIDGTREHEALVTVAARPSDVHAALLLLGLAAGKPGSWRVENDTLVEIPPEGPALSVTVRWRDAAGTERTAPIATWIRDVRSGAAPALDRWLFAGSLMQRMRDGSERYLADGSGSVIGLVTFGDEVLALPIVRPDAEAVAEPEWEAWTERLPPIGTAVTLLLERVADTTPVPVPVPALAPPSEGR